MVWYIDNAEFPRKSVRETNIKQNIAKSNLSHVSEHTETFIGYIASTGNAETEVGPWSGETSDR